MKVLSLILSTYLVIPSLAEVIEGSQKQLKTFTGGHCKNTEMLRRFAVKFLVPLGARLFAHAIMIVSKSRRLVASRTKLLP